jgi:hypothetical protein
MGSVAGFADRTRTSVIRATLRGLFWALSMVLTIAPRSVAAQEASSSSGGSSPTKLPEIHVIATTPVAPPARTAPAARVSAPAAAAPAPAPAEATAAKPIPGAVDQDKIPSNVQTAGASDFEYSKTPDLLQSMVRALPGVALSSQTGNEFQLDLNYRGFIASPVIGTPQGLAVYQNGVRINEIFGDIVNWDFIPQERHQSTHACSQQSGLRSQCDRRRARVSDEEWIHLSRRRRRNKWWLIRTRCCVRSSRRPGREPIRLHNGRCDRRRRLAPGYAVIAAARLC